MGRQATPAELIRYAKWYFPIATVLCTAAVFMIKSQQVPWAQIGAGFVVVCIVGSFPLIGNVMAAVAGSVLGLLTPILCNLVYRLFHWVLPEPGGRQITRDDFAETRVEGRFMVWCGIAYLALGLVIGGLLIGAEKTGKQDLRDIAFLLGAFGLFPLSGGVLMSFALAGLYSVFQIVWLAGRITAWLMRKIAPQSAPLSGLCAGGLVLTLFFGWTSRSEDIPPDQWQGRAILLTLAFIGFVMLIWPLADAQKSSIFAMILVAAGSTAIGMASSNVSPAAALFFALACFLLVEIFRKLRSEAVPKSAMTLRIAASVVLGSALEGGILLYANRTAPREPEALAPPDPEKTLVER